MLPSMKCSHATRRRRRRRRTRAPRRWWRPRWRTTRMCSACRVSSCTRSTTSTLSRLGERARWAPRSHPEPGATPTFSRRGEHSCSPHPQPQPQRCTRDPLYTPPLARPPLPHFRVAAPSTPLPSRAHAAQLQAAAWVCRAVWRLRAPAAVGCRLGATAQGGRRAHHVRHEDGRARPAAARGLAALWPADTHARADAA
eukprot:877663-Prymnesium_polylepis.1